VGDDVSFPAQIVKVQTLADGGLRFTFDAPETEVLAMAQLAELKRLGVVGTLTFSPQEQAKIGEGVEGGWKR